MTQVILSLLISGGKAGGGEEESGARVFIERVDLATAGYCRPCNRRAMIESARARTPA